MSAFNRERLVIDVVGATKRYGDVVAVADVSLSVRSGHVVGLLGANGAGKTTLIKAILGLEALDSGTVSVLGDRPTLQVRSKLGYMPQGLGLYSELSVRENAEFVAEAFGIRQPPPLPEPLMPVADAQVRSIGLGLQRQLAFYCALLHEPELLILDEPTSGVGPLARARLLETIRQQADQGIGVLVTTHYMQEAEQCDELVLLSRGRKVVAGTLDDILSGQKAYEVLAEHWQNAFEVLTAARLPVTLAGRSIRTVGTTCDNIVNLLSSAGLDATVTETQATLDEAMVLTENASRNLSLDNSTPGAERQT